MKKQKKMMFMIHNGEKRMMTWWWCWITKMVTFRSCGHCWMCFAKIGGRCRSYSHNSHVGTPRLFVVFPGDKPLVAEARVFFWVWKRYKLICKLPQLCEVWYSDLMLTARCLPYLVYEHVTRFLTTGFKSNNSSTDCVSVFSQITFNMYTYENL